LDFLPSGAKKGQARIRVQISADMIEQSRSSIAAFIEVGKELWSDLAKFNNKKASQFAGFSIYKLMRD